MGQLSICFLISEFFGPKGKGSAVPYVGLNNTNISLEYYLLFYY
jgi:hypothetical protein